jgi:hypothetical protein
MKYIITIFLIFTHYVCGGPCIAEKDTDLNIAIPKTPEKFYKQTTQLKVLKPHKLLTQPAALFTTSVLQSDTERLKG